VTKKVRGRVGSVDHQFTTPRRREDKNNLYCPSIELKMLVEYLEIDS
jgi:hypothetical protein